MMSQGGKTNGLAFNVMGHRLDDDPAPLLYIGPTRNNVVNVIEPKIDGMLRETPSLWAKTVKGKKYTRTRKIVGGVSLRLAWAGSPTELAADSACVVLVDEIDRMERDIKGEGNIVELADARHSSFPDGKTIGFSTPTEGNVDTFAHPDTGLEHWKPAEAEQVPSAIWVLWQEGTRHEWAWPCPECREYFVPRFRLLVWPSSASAKEIRDEARLACPHCGAAIATEHKAWMNARGVYVAPGQRPLALRDDDSGVYMADYTAGDAPVLKRRGGRHISVVEFGDFALPAGATAEDATFWVSGLANFSAKKTFGAIAARAHKALTSGDTDRVKGVLNTELGELFKFGGEAPEWEQVAARKQSYQSGDVPEGVAALFATVDVQKDCLYYVVRGWGRAWSSWLVEAGTLWGDTKKDEVWEDLEALLEAEYQGRTLDRMAIDSGYRSDEVYRFCRKHRGIAIPTKGHLQLDRPFYASKVDVNHRGQTRKRGSLQLWHLDTDRMKSWVHGRMEVADGRPGAWCLPGDIHEDYCRQIVSEERIVKPSGRVAWQTTGPNHYLDCEALQAFLARKERALLRRRLARMPAPKTQVAPEPVAPTETEHKTPPVKQPVQRARRRRTRRGGYVHAW